MTEFRVDVQDPSQEHVDIAVVRVHKGKICARCHDNVPIGEDSPNNTILTFGLVSDYDMDDATEVFYWCACGHKWIEEPKQRSEQNEG